MRSTTRVLSAVAALAFVVAAAGVTMSWTQTVSSGPEPRPVVTTAPPGPTTTTTAVPAVTTGCTTVVITPPSTPDDYQGDLCVPDGPHRDVAVVLVHGGGGFGGSRADMAGWAEVYQQAGYVTLSVDYLIFGQTTRSPVYPEPEQDVKAAVQYLRAHREDLGIQTDRIVLHGSSAGSRLGGQVYVSGDDPYFFGAEMWPGTPDHINAFIGFYGYYSGESADAERYYGGPKDSPDDEVRERWQEADTIARAAEADGPALLIHGEDDGVIPVRHTLEFAAALEDHGFDVSAEILPGADHGFDVVDGGALTPAGLEMADLVLTWLEARFPPP
jgi:acetyl esterase/lipase